MNNWFSRLTSGANTWAAREAGLDTPLSVTAASITPATFDVDYIDEREFSQTLISPVGQDITLDASTNFILTAAAVEPSPKTIVLSAGIRVQTGAAGPSGQGVSLGAVKDFTFLGITPSGKDIILRRSETPAFPIDALGISPGPQVVSLTVATPLTQVEIQPVGQALTTNSLTPVTRAAITPQSNVTRLRIAQPFSHAQVEPSPQDLSRITGTVTLVLADAASVTPSTGNVTYALLARLGAASVIPVMRPMFSDDWTEESSAAEDWEWQQDLSEEWTEVSTNSKTWACL